MAAVPNTAQMAPRAGNSPQMIFGHYRELVRTMDAEKCFGVTPEAVEAARAARQSGAGGEDRGAARGGGGVSLVLSLIME